MAPIQTEEEEEGETEEATALAVSMAIAGQSLPIPTRSTRPWWIQWRVVFSSCICEYTIHLELHMVSAPFFVWQTETVVTDQGRLAKQGGGCTPIPAHAPPMFQKKRW